MNTTRQQKIEAMLQRELANIFLLDSRNACDALSDALQTPVYDVMKREQ